MAPDLKTLGYLSNAKATSIGLNKSKLVRAQDSNPEPRTKNSQREPISLVKGTLANVYLLFEMLSMYCTIGLIPQLQDGTLEQNSYNALQYVALKKDLFLVYCLMAETKVEADSLGFVGASSFSPHFFFHG